MFPFVSRTELDNQLRNTSVAPFIFDKLKELIDSEAPAITNSRDFLVRMKCNRWVIFSDYSFPIAQGASTNLLKRNNVATFVVVPLRKKSDFAKYRHIIAKLIPEDSKAFTPRQKISASIANGFNKIPFLAISFVLPKQYSVFQDEVTDRVKIRQFLDTISKGYWLWAQNDPNPENKAYYNAIHNSLEEFALRKEEAANIHLLRAVVFVSLLAAWVEVLVLKNCPSNIIFWGSDRGALYDWPGKLHARDKGGLIYELAIFVAHNILHKEPFGQFVRYFVGEPELSGDIWYDEFNRLADYIAGALVGIDENKRFVSPSKFDKLFQRYLSNNKHAITLLIDPPNMTIKEIVFNRHLPHR